MTHQPDPSAIADPHARFYCGIDWHARTAALFVCDCHGHRRLAARVAARPDEVIRHLGQFVPHLVAGVEATGGASALADELQEAGIPCRIGDPSRLRFLNPSRRKSDPRDAQFIALMLADDNFPEIYQPTPEVRELRDWLRVRAKYVDIRQGFRARQAQRRPRRRGLPPHEPGGPLLPGAAIGHKSHLSPSDLTAATDATLDAALTGPIAHLEAEAANRARRLFPDVFERLTAIPGVGPLTAATLCAEIGDPARFKRADHLLAYARLVVPADRSGDRIVRLDHPKGGNQHLRRAFLDAAHHVSQHCPQAEAWLERRFPSDSQRGLGLVAAARRLAEGVYVVWRKGVDFDPVRAFPPSSEGGAV